MPDDLSKHFELGRRRAAEGKSTPTGLLSDEFASKAEKAAAQRGWEAQKAAEAHGEQIHRERTTPSSSSSRSSSSQLFGEIGEGIFGLVGAVLGMIWGLVQGFVDHGIGGALLYAAIGGIGGALIGVFVGLMVIWSLVIGIVAGAIWLIIWVFSNLWDLGKPTTHPTPTEQALTEVAPAIEQVEEHLSDQAVEQPPTATATEDYRTQQEPAEEPNALPIELTPAPEPEQSLPLLTTYYFHVGTPEASSTIEIAAPSPQKAETILRDFRGNPTVIEGPTTVVTWQ